MIAPVKKYVDATTRGGMVGVCFMEDDMSDWIDWTGGECPMEPKTLHSRRLRDGSELECECESTDILRRAYWRVEGSRCDIVAYKVGG